VAASFSLLPFLSPHTTPEHVFVNVLNELQRVCWPSLCSLPPCISNILGTSAGSSHTISLVSLLMHTVWFLHQTHLIHWVDPPFGSTPLLFQLYKVCKNINRPINQNATPFMCLNHTETCSSTITSK